MAAGQAYKGKNLRIMVEGKSIYHATECSFNSSINLEEIATKDTNGTMVIASNYTWGLSTNMLVADKPVGSTQDDFVGMLNKHKSGTMVAVEFTTDIAGDILIAGNAFIESIDLTSPTEGFATGSASFKGNGDYTVSAVV